MTELPDPLVPLEVDLRDFGFMPLDVRRLHSQIARAGGGHRRRTPHGAPRSGVHRHGDRHMGASMAVSRKIRFDVFKRDGFRCQYCGRTPPIVLLEVDHIHPRSKGGSDHEDNLLTSCEDCNRGKSAGLLTAVPRTIAEKAAVIAEREAQLAGYNEILAAKRAREDKQIDDLESLFHEMWPDREFTRQFRESIRSDFLGHLSHDEMVAAMAKACGKCATSYDSLKYFCGICWSTRRQRGG